MPNVIVCPECRKELRTSRAVVAGQKMRCPACAASFGATVAPDVAAAPGLSLSRKRSRARLLLALSATLAVLAILGVGAFVWPGFLVFGRPPSNARSLLAYVPPNAPIVGGAQVGLFRTDPQFRDNWNAVQQKIAQLDQIPEDARALLNDADEIVVAGSTDLQSAVFVASTKRPFDAAKVRRLARAGPSRTIRGQTFHPTDELIPGRESYLALPSDKVLVLGVMSQDEFVNLLAAAPHTRLHPDLQEQVDHAHDALVWVAARFDDGIKQQLQFVSMMIAPFELRLGPDVPVVLGAVQRGKGALLSVDLGGDDLQLRIGVTCKDADDALKLKTSFGNFWNTQAKKLLALGGDAGFGIPGLGKLAGEVQQTFVLEQRGNTVIAVLGANQDTLKELAAAVKQNGFNFLGGFNLPLPKMR